jgi:ABC-type multidrug transport system ATPase subunit
MSYVASLFTKSQLATFIIAAGGQCALLLLYFIAFLVILTYTPAADVDSHLSIANYAIGAFFPAGNLLRALLLSLNEFSLLCRGGTEVAPYPGAIGIYGAPILYLTIQSVLLFTFLVLWDSGWKPTFLMRSKHRSTDQEEIEAVDPEVYEEARRVDSSNDELRVKHVTKAFGSNVAVEDVSFGVPRSEIFALLGPNGAGKSTTIGLIRGDTRPSDKVSEILIENNSIIRSRATARSHLGVCPQFDAMDQMTAVEHLRFYAQVRGVRDVENNVEEVVKAVGLGQFKSRMAAKLSGGNKRKLSLGIALMGDPSVLLLDEPSSGMDAASKRVMWRTLASVSDGRSLVLTTHSMEEADALADRAGIMAKRMLALGTADQLRKKHGDAYHVHLVHRDAPYTSDEAMDEIKAFVRRTFAGATTEERAFHGQLRFSVPNNHTIEEDTSSMDDAANDKKGGVRSTVTSSSGSSISALFAQLEANKENLGFQYYSVSQATLDQVFLNIVTKHNVVEENYARAHTKRRKFSKIPSSLLAACCIY